MNPVDWHALSSLSMVIFVTTISKRTFVKISMETSVGASMKLPVKKKTRGDFNENIFCGEIFRFFSGDLLWRLQRSLKKGFL